MPARSTSYLGNRELLVGLLGRDDRGVRRKHEVDARVRHQVGLNSVISAFRAPSKRREAVSEDDLRDEAVEVGVRGALDVETAAADVVDGLVVNMTATSVCSRASGREDRVVRLDDRGGLRRRVDGEASLDLRP